ncbi:MAG: ATP-binding cassette domain-containing protein [Solirubrobacteraceae bacterium]
MLEAAAITRTFGGKHVLGPLDLRLDVSERLAVTGPNGAGKSTLIRCIAGTLAPCSGEITVAGHPAGTHEAKRRIGVAFAQERAFYLRLNGAENLLTFALLRLPPARARAAVKHVVSELELEDIAAQRIDRCSSGMVQQLAIARALLGEPSLLLLDEPTRSLDDDAVARLWAAVDRRPHMALIIATHRREDVERCQHHVALAAG